MTHYECNEVKYPNGPHMAIMILCNSAFFIHKLDTNHRLHNNRNSGFELATKTNNIDDLFLMLITHYPSSANFVDLTEQSLMNQLVSQTFFLLAI